MTIHLSCWRSLMTKASIFSGYFGDSLSMTLLFYLLTLWDSPQPFCFFFFTLVMLNLVQHLVPEITAYAVKNSGWPGEWRKKGLAYRRSAKGGFRTSKQALLATGFMHFCMNSKYYFRNMCNFGGQDFVQRTISLWLKFVICIIFVMQALIEFGARNE